MLESDIDAIVEMAKENVFSTKLDDVSHFSEACVRGTCRRSIDTGNPIFFVVEKDRKVIGFLQMGLSNYDFRDGFYTTQRVLYVSPENRGTRASVLLMRRLVDESVRLGAAEIVGGNDNDFMSDRTARFLEHFGFKRVGFAMTKRIG